jgi:hypothetical protein
MASLASRLSSPPRPKFIYDVYRQSFRFGIRVHLHRAFGGNLGVA